MTTIKATCPSCGEVTLTPVDIDLRVDPHDQSVASYGFACPSCGEEVRKAADERIVRLLISGGVEAQPVEAPRPTLAERSTGPQLQPDDLLDFHALLARDDWFDHLLSASTDTRPS